MVVQVGAAFEATVRRESVDITAGREQMRLPATSSDAAVEVGVHARADEPWITYAPADRAGLALSGGGIRSSAFTLGLLQSLSERGVLPLFDYLATVSGGGYTGGFWTTWSRAHGPGEHFPGAPWPPTRDRTPLRHEHPAIRHLREHSRFLAPRMGLGYVDLWEAMLALVAGMVPTLVFATALFATGVVAWRLVVLGVVWTAMHPWWLPALVFVGAFGLFAGMEHRWQRMRIAMPGARSGAVVLGSAVVSATVLAVAVAITVLPESPVWTDDPIAPNKPWRAAWEAALAYPIGGLAKIRGYLLPAGLALGSAAVWAVRWLGSWSLDWLGVIAERRPILTNAPASLGRALERSSARLLFFALVAAAFAVIWHLSSLLMGTEGRASDAEGVLETFGITGGLSAVASAAFGSLSRLLQPSRTDDAAGLLARLRPALPQIVAVIAVLLYLTAVTIACRSVDGALSEQRLSSWWFALAPAVALLLAGSDHGSTGLHEFYRRRIAVAFLQFEPEDCPTGGDCLAPTQETLARPVHLVCCAANGVAADPVRTLYRGARSAVLSRHGLLVGDRVSPQPIRLSDALTASAAAFNSQMGGNSLRLGAAVSMLMTALNLRLGLWLRTRDRGSLATLGGWRLVTEMFGATQSDATWVHLSDGGHFDNTGAYELIRRHCRYVVVADCGADPKVRFDDLSELIRRVREDFGVEIEIDVSPLRPDASGLSKQHVAVGTIFYGPRPTSDQGTLIVVKPTLTGDEPPDVTQYRARNTAFPHESTGDQFFDEPQWESYRRLGEHCGRTVFAYVAELTDEQRVHGERVFTDARRQWHPLPADFDGHLVALSTRCAEIEAELRDDMPPWLRAEFSPELVPSPAQPGRTADGDAKEFLFFLAVSQLLEDAWLTCKLDTHGEHPLNEGWFAYISRWATMPTFERLWPLLRPVCSPGFREFIKRRFGLRVRLEGEVIAATEAGGTRILALERAMGAMRAFPSADGTSEVHDLELGLSLTTGSPRIVVGTARVTTHADRVARWALDDVRVPARLHGAGVVGRFLDALVGWCRTHGAETIEVTASAASATGHLAEYNRTIDLYRGRGFQLDRDGTTLRLSLSTGRTQ